jgi:hypothetical protein
MKSRKIAPGLSVAACYSIPEVGIVVLEQDAYRKLLSALVVCFRVSIMEGKLQTYDRAGVLTYAYVYI